MKLPDARSQARAEANRTGQVMLVISGAKAGDWATRPAAGTFGLGAERIYPDYYANRRGVGGSGRQAESLACCKFADERGDDRDF